MENVLRYYSPEFKESILRKVFASSPESVASISSLTGIPKSTIFTWKYKKEKSLKNTVKITSKCNWDGARKFHALLETSNYSEEEVSIYCRKHGIYANDLEQWRLSAIASYDGSSTSLTKDEAAAFRAEKKKNKILMKELDRKEKALAETAALLVLKKKAQSLWGEQEDE